LEVTDKTYTIGIGKIKRALALRDGQIDYYGNKMPTSQFESFGPTIINNVAGKSVDQSIHLIFRGGKIKSWIGKATIADTKDGFRIKKDGDKLKELLKRFHNVAYIVLLIKDGFSKEAIVYQYN